MAWNRTVDCISNTAAELPQVAHCAVEKAVTAAWLLMRWEADLCAEEVTLMPRERRMAEHATCDYSVMLNSIFAIRMCSDKCAILHRTFLCCCSDQACGALFQIAMLLVSLEADRPQQQWGVRLIAKIHETT